jgi:acetoin utilization deacetylase AcuC-like enzyme
MTLLYSDPLFLDHDTGPGHPERAERLRSVTRKLDESWLIKKCRPGKFGPISDEAALRVHSPQVLQRIRDAVEAGGAHVDPDTVVSPPSLDVAKYAAGAAVAAVDAVLAGTDKSALCLVRPPGHHATPTQSMGFCLFNNIALAARHALDKHQLSRILIVDWDVHHGNGTQDIFYEEPRVMFFSIHRYGNGFYPGSGSVNETGSGAGLGFTKNVPLAFGISRSEYLNAFSQALEECAAKIKPELVLISAGFDAHRRDPIGSLGLDSEDFEPLTRRVMDVADVHARGRIVSCLEGGYNLQALAESVEVHLQTLLSAQT